MRDGHNGYGPSAGIPAAREAVAAEYTRERIAGHRRSRVHHRRHLRRDRARAERARRRGRRSARADADLSAVHGGAREARRARDVLPDRPVAAAGCRISIISQQPRHAGDARARRSSIRTTRPARVYPTATRRALLEFADRHGLLILADEVYGDLGYDGPVAPLGSLDPDAPIISFSSLSKAYLAPGWRTGWMAIGRSPRLDDVVAAVRKLADGRLCSTVPMQYAIAAALTGDRSHQPAFRAALKARARSDRRRACARCRASRCVAPTAAFYAMPRVALPPGRTDEDYVLGAAARDRRAVRLRLGLRPAGRRRLPAHRLPGVARRADARSTT